MKSLAGFAIALMLVASLASSCVKDPEPTGGDGTGDGPSLVFVITQGTDPFPDVFVGISNSSEDRENGIYAASRFTGSTGRAKFENTAEGVYYYTARHSANGSTSLREGEYNFVPGQNGEVTIRF